MKKRYALVGTGGRGVLMYARPIVEEYRDQAELVVMCDVNPKRLELANDLILIPSVSEGSTPIVYEILHFVQDETVTFSNSLNNIGYSSRASCLCG